jgi:nitrate reductase beta subunit
LTAVRRYMRSVRVDQNPDSGILDAADLAAEAAESIYRLLALARYDERFVLPTRTPEDEHLPHFSQGSCGYRG